MHFRIDERFNKLINNFIKCKNGSKECDASLEPKMREFLKIDTYSLLISKEYKLT